MFLFVYRSFPRYCWMESFDRDREERLPLENYDEMLTNDRSCASDTSNSR